MSFFIRRETNIYLVIAIIAFVAIYFILEIRETINDKDNVKNDKYTELLSYQYEDINRMSFAVYTGFDTVKEIQLSDLNSESLFYMLQNKLDPLTKIRVNSNKTYLVEIEFYDGVINEIYLSFINDDYLLVSFDDRRFDSETILDFFIQNNFFESY